MIASQRQALLAGGELADKSQKVENAFRGRIPLGGGEAPARPVHAMLGALITYKQ
jgi:hypothetical protein